MDFAQDIAAFNLGIATMSKNKDVLDLYNFAFPEETYGIRISVTTNQVNYGKIKGGLF